MDGEHETQRSEDGNHAGEKLRKAHDEAVGELIDIGNDLAYHLAVWVRVHILERELFQFFKGRRSNILHHMVHNPVVADVHHPLQE